MTTINGDYRPPTRLEGTGGPVAAAGEPLLEVSGLCVDYGIGRDAIHAVVGADLVLRRGEVLGLAGESGSGKSTLAYAITRLLRSPGVITGGRVIFHRYAPAGSDRPAVPAPGADHQRGPGSIGRHGTAPDSAADPHLTLDLLTAGEEQLRGLRWTHIAVVLQSAMHALNPVISVGAQLTDVLTAHRPGLDRAARRARAGQLLEMVGIPADRLGNYPHELSGGMRQRVMIAMALALEPQIVIMDEPTTALDVVTQREILEELMDLRDRLGFSILFITHDLSLLIEIADTIAVMYAGRLVETAGARQLYRAPRHPYSLGLLRSFPALHGPRMQMTGIGGSPPDLRQLPGGCVFHPRCPYAMDKCGTQPPPVLLSLHDGDRSAACWLQEPGEKPPPELAQPDLAQPELAQPDLARADLAQPELAQPDLAQPELAQPDLARA
ncbi:MAG TPA: ABC transporter ATP-binding protein, partial [Streptosporangiaceae bacterium]|nr:ABC transporter ATP-binding protein [Streptosporangiaceae bacterium]